jgi:hypothetical protein
MNVRLDTPLRLSQFAIKCSEFEYEKELIKVIGHPIKGE